MQFSDGGRSHHQKIVYLKHLKLDHMTESFLPPENCIHELEYKAQYLSIFKAIFRGPLGGLYRQVWLYVQ